MLKPLRLLPLMGGAAAALVLACFLFVTPAGADNAITWLDPSALALHKQADVASIPASLNGNIDCYQENNSSCTISTPYGYVNTSASVRLADSDNYRPVVSYVDNREHYLPVPNSSTFITYTTEPVYGFYLNFNYNFISAVKPSDIGLGPFYKVVNPPDGKLADKSGKRLAADYESMSFSENGEWMVLSDPNVAMLRVNLQTFEVLPFAPGFNYTIGLSPSPQTAITNDGRYAVVASKNFSSFKIYDLDTCSSAPNVISGPVNCEARDLQNYLNQQIIGYSGVVHLRFTSDDTLGLYASYDAGSSHKFAKYLLTNGTAAFHEQDYLALGDSYMSGEGAYSYLPGTDTSDNQCHVSAVSYPYLLGQYLNYNAYHSVGCSGAKTPDIIDTSGAYKGQAKPYLSRQNLEKNSQFLSILANFQQGYIDQLDFVKQYQPKVVTVSIGGNDIGFSSILQSCLLAGTCYSTYEDRLEFVRQVEHAFPKIVDTYTKLKNAGGPDARIYIIGYPQIALPGGDCAVNVHMNNDELIFAEQAIDYLDAVISQAAAKAGVFYVDGRDAFFGHRLCEAGPGSVAVNGISAGNDFPDKLGGPIGRESYHPNAFGHLLLENRILATTHNLTNPMPAADLGAAPPPERDLEILNAPRSDRSANTTEFDPGISAELAYQGSPLDISIDGTAHSLAPKTILQSEIHSTPRQLGGLTTDSNGNVSGQVVIPADMPTGYHTLHFFGADLNGQPIDIYKSIYIAETADDLDGDNILDSTQKCVGVESANQDFDQDGIDDSCDGNIGPAPTSTSSAIIVSANLSSSSDGLAVSGTSPANSNSGPVDKSPNSQVLGLSTKMPPTSSTYGSIRIPGYYFAEAGIVFLSITSMAYLFKIVKWP